MDASKYHGEGGETQQKHSLGQVPHSQATIHHGTSKSFRVQWPGLCSAQSPSVYVTLDKLFNLFILHISHL